MGGDTEADALLARAQERGAREEDLRALVEALEADPAGWAARLEANAKALTRLVFFHAMQDDHASDAPLTEALAASPSAVVRGEHLAHFSLVARAADNYEAVLVGVQRAGTVDDVLPHLEAWVLEHFDKGHILKWLDGGRAAAEVVFLAHAEEWMKVLARTPKGPMRDAIRRAARKGERLDDMQEHRILAEMVIETLAKEPDEST